MLDHDRQVAQQFGAAAAAYLGSAVHAQGADLERLAADAAAAPGLRVLDLGCGAGHVAFAVAPHAAEAVAYDLSPDMLAVVEREAARRGLTSIAIRRGPAEALPFADAAFDRIYTRFSAHHWRDVPAALAEARRVLAPGGRLIVVDILGAGQPLHDTFLQAIELLRDVSHVRDYSAEEWRAMLRTAGFGIAAERAWRLRLDFEPWLARMRTPPERAAAIRSLLDAAPEEVRAYLHLEADHSFQADVGWFECAAQAAGAP